METPTYLIDLSRAQLGSLAAQVGIAACTLVSGIRERDVVRVAEDLLFSRCRDRATCSRAGQCHAAGLVWSTAAMASSDPPLCLVEPEIDDLPWIFATAVLDRSAVSAAERVRAAGILRALFRGALAPCLQRAEGCPL